MNLSSHSSNVVLTLLVCGVELALSHVGSQFLIVRDAPCSYNEGPAEIIISVDGVVERTEVFLPHGVRVGRSNRVLYI